MIKKNRLMISNREKTIIKINICEDQPIYYTGEDTERGMRERETEKRTH